VDRVVIVGAGLAGLRTVEALRQQGYAGSLTLVGAEAHPPYTRPPLSKEVLRGEVAPETAILRAAEEFAELDATLVLGRRATRLDTDARTLELDDGTTLPYDGLVIATGATPRWLPGGRELAGVFVLRTIDDAVAIRDALASKPRVAVVGGGFIGSEVASSARMIGCDVTVIEVAPAPLALALGVVIGNACADLHRAAGVDLRVGVGVESLVGETQVAGVRLTDGSQVDADVVVLGLGVTPEVGWLAGSSVEVATEAPGGVICDARCETTQPGVFAVGDVARWHHTGLGEDIRIEHWTNATEQAAAVAAAMLGATEPFAPVPYVWSDQFGLKIQVLGRPRATDDLEVVHGSIESGKFVATYSRDGRITGAVGFRSAGKLMAYRALLAAPTAQPDALADANVT
jgi:NADPH-dependent 2,4-dienoyl-CoA reductase/sulfur reductase-like enzyme